MYTIKVNKDFEKCPRRDLELHFIILFNWKRRSLGVKKGYSALLRRVVRNFFDQTNDVCNILSKLVRQKKTK